MADDSRNAIVAAIVTRLKTIKKTGGFKTDAGTNVTTWRAVPPASSECPTLDVRDSTRRKKGVYTQGVKDYDLTVDVMAFEAIGSTVNQDLDNAIEDIIKALEEGDDTFGGLTIEIEYEEDNKFIDQREVKTGVAVVRFAIRYRKI